MDGAGGAARKGKRSGGWGVRACRSWPHSLLGPACVRAGEDPLIMQIAPGVPTEGHLLCALWAAASRLQRQAMLQRLLQTQPGPLPHPLPVSQPSRPDPSSSAPQSPEEAWRRSGEGWVSAEGRNRGHEGKRG